jgi:hypothetical protein
MVLGCVGTASILEFLCPVVVASSPPPPSNTSPALAIVLHLPPAPPRGHELVVLALSHTLFHVAPPLPLSLLIFTVALSRLSLAFLCRVTHTVTRAIQLPVTALADRLLMDGESKLLASGGEDCTIRLWSMSTRAKNHPLIATFHGHEKALSFLSVAWYALSNYLNEVHYTVTMCIMLLSRTYMFWHSASSNNFHMI